MAAKIDTRCLECSHEFPVETMVLTDEGWSCPRCNSLSVEAILIKGYDHSTVNVKYIEGGGHD